MQDTTGGTTDLESTLRDLYGDEAIWIAEAVRQRAAQITVPPQVGGWSHEDAWLISYPDQFQVPGVADLASLHEFFNRRLRTVLNGVHVLPCYPWTSDDGYAITDYLSIEPSYGAWSDIEALAGDTRLMLDAVINHMSASSEWFRRYLAGDPEYRKFFREADPTADLSATVRPRTTPLLTEFEGASGSRWIWTTFSPDQVDLDYRNPHVFLAMVDVLYEYVRRGAGAIRLDAVQFIGKREGSPSINLPEAHHVVKALRTAVDAIAPSVLVVTESNVPHDENVAYLGTGDEREAQLVYQFALAPLVLHTMVTGDDSKLRSWAATSTDTRPGTSFLNFLASHDGVGVRPVEGILSAPEVQHLVDLAVAAGGHVNARSLPDGTSAPYELACTWFDLMAHGYDEDQAIARHLASHSIMLALRGIPLVYVHSLFGTSNDHELVAATGRSRSINRRKFTDVAGLDAALDDPATRPARVLSGLTQLLRLRTGDPAFHPEAHQTVLDTTPGVFAVERGNAARVYVNVTGETQVVDAAGWVDHSGRQVSHLDPWHTSFVRPAVTRA